MKKIIVMLIIFILITSCNISNESDANESDANESNANESNANESNANESNANESNANESNANESNANELVSNLEELIKIPDTILILKNNDFIEMTNPEEISELTYSIIQSSITNLDEYKSMYEPEQIMLKLKYNSLRNTEINLQNYSTKVIFDTIEISDEGMLFLMPQGTALGKVEID